MAGFKGQLVIWLGVRQLIEHSGFDTLAGIQAA